MSCSTASISTSCRAKRSLCSALRDRARARCFAASTPLRYRPPAPSSSTASKSPIRRPTSITCVSTWAWFFSASISGRTKLSLKTSCLPSSSFLKRIRRQPRPVLLNSSRVSDFSTRPTPIRQAFRAVSSSALLLPAHLPWNPRLCSLTNRPLRLTRNSWVKCLPS